MPNRLPGSDKPRSPQQQATIPDDVRQAIRKETLAQFSKWLVGALGAALVAALLGWWFYLKPYLITVVGGVPTNAIVAFDIRTKCPEGWSDFDAAAGRMIIGSGKGNGLSQRDFGYPGGKETVTLSLEQMPPHAHAYIDWRGTTDGACTFSGCNGRGNDVSRTTERAGGKDGVAQPVEIMPPYLALRICRKD